MNWLIDEVSQHKLCSLVNLISMYFDTNPSTYRSCINAESDSCMVFDTFPSINTSDTSTSTTANTTTPPVDCHGAKNISAVHKHCFLHSCLSEKSVRQASNIRNYVKYTKIWIFFSQFDHLTKNKMEERNTYNNYIKSTINLLKKKKNKLFIKR